MVALVKYARRRPEYRYRYDADTGLVTEHRRLLDHAMPADRASSTEYRTAGGWPKKKDMPTGSPAASMMRRG